MPVGFYFVVAIGDRDFVAVALASRKQQPTGKNWRYRRKQQAKLPTSSACWLRLHMPVGFYFVAVATKQQPTGKNFAYADDSNK